MPLPSGTLLHVATGGCSFVRNLDDLTGGHGDAAPDASNTCATDCLGGACLAVDGKHGKPQERDEDAGRGHEEIPGIVIESFSRRIYSRSRWSTSRRRWS